MAQITVFGSSTVEGIGDPDGGWVDRLKCELHQNDFSHGVFNLGVGGQTTKELLVRLPSELAARAWPDTPNLCIISIGTNDSRADGDATSFISTVDEYKQRLSACVQAAKQHAQVLLVGFTPVDNVKTQPYDSTFFSSERIQLFEQAMQAVAAKQSVRMLPLFEDCTKQDWQAFLYSDGLHLNATGHEWILQQVRPTVQQMIQ